MSDFDSLLLSAEQIEARNKALQKYMEIQQGMLKNLGLISAAQEKVIASEEELQKRIEAKNEQQKRYERQLLRISQLEREKAEAVLAGNAALVASTEAQLNAQRVALNGIEADLEDAESKRRKAETIDLVTKSANKSTKSFVTMTTGIKDMVNSSDGFDQLLVRLANGEIGITEMKDGFDTAIKTFNSMFSKVNLIANAMKFMYDSMVINIAVAKEIDTAIVNFNKTIGSPGGFNDLLSDASDDLLRFGVSAADAVQNIGTLVSTVRSFADLNQDAQEEIAQFVSLLDKMGFSADAQAKNIVFLNKSFGLSEKAAAKFNTRLMSIANSLDMPIGDVVQGFQDAQKVLGASAGSAEELSQQFGQLAAQADATNLSIGKLIDLSMKFDTFDSAAQQVGKLNAMLGGPFLSTVEMVTATNPAERIEMLADSLDRAGKSFDDMSYFERKAIADAAGLQDVNDLALLMSGNLSDITGPDLSEAEIVEMKQQMKEFNDVMQAFANMAMATVVSLAPFIFMIKDVFSFVGNVLSTVLMPAFKLVEGIIFGIESVIDGVSSVFSALTDAIGESNIEAVMGFMKTAAEAIAFAFEGVGSVLGSIAGGGILGVMAVQTAIMAKNATIFAAQMAVAGVRMAVAAAKGLGGAIASIFQTFAQIPLGIGIPAAVGAAAGLYALYNSATQADDLLSPGQDSDGYGDRMILGPEGAFALNNRDTVVAGTNLTQNTVNNNNTTTQAAAPAAAAPTGPINMNVVLSIDGSEIRTVVNSVKVDPTLNSNLYNSIAKLITSGDEAR